MAERIGYTASEPEMEEAGLPLSDIFVAIRATKRIATSTPSLMARSLTKSNRPVRPWVPWLNRRRREIPSCADRRG